MPSPQHQNHTVLSTSFYGYRLRATSNDFFTMTSQETTTAAEMEETIARISSHKGVEGVMIMNREGACRGIVVAINMLLIVHPFCFIFYKYRSYDITISLTHFCRRNHSIDIG